MDETQTPNRTPLRRPVRQTPQPQEEKKERIKVWMGAALIITAGSIDAFQALLNVLLVGEVLSTIISICADVIFIIWLWMLGVGFVKSPKKMAAMLIQALVGLIPVINTLPELTIGILAIVLITRSEDKGGMLGKAAGMAQGKIKA
jgi:hypothetical protein